MCKLIGRSLSFCIQDILSGKVGIDEVCCIITSTSCKDYLAFQDVLEHYEHIHWNNYQKYSGSIIAWKLWYSDRIIQPRLYDDKMSQDISNYVIWTHDLYDCKFCE